jgi:hypothetical protein
MSNRSRYFSESEPMPHPPVADGVRPGGQARAVREPGYRVFFYEEDPEKHATSKKAIRRLRQKNSPEPPKVYDHRLNTHAARYHALEERQRGEREMKLRTRATETTAPLAPVAENLRLRSPEKPPFIQRFEHVMRLRQGMQARNEGRALEYASRFAERGEAETTRLLDLALETFRQVDPYDLIANRPLEHLSGPMVMTSPEHWWAVEGLIEALVPFYTPDNRGENGVVEASPELFAAAIFGWLNQSQQSKHVRVDSPEGRKLYRTFDKEDIIGLIRLLGGVRDADCQYYEKMFFAGGTNPGIAMARLAGFFETTARYLADEATTEDYALSEVIGALDQESQMLRIIQAQEYRFTTYDRPVSSDVVLLPTACYFSRRVEEDRTRGVEPDYRKYAEQIVGAFRSHRCLLTDADVERICRFFLGHSEKRKSPATVTPLDIPWMILRQEAWNEGEPDRLAEFRAALPAGSEKEEICAALSKTFLETAAMKRLTPDLLFAFRKRGYLHTATIAQYKDLGVDAGGALWRDHQERLGRISAAKNPMKISGQTAIGVEPMSGWTITIAHHDQAIAAQKSIPTLVRLQEIANGLPIQPNRDCVVAITLGDVGTKKAKGMASVEERIALAQRAVEYDEGIFVMPRGYVREGGHRSERVKELLVRLHRDYQANFSIVGRTGCPSPGTAYPGEHPVVLIGATEKLGRTENGNLATRFVKESDKPEQDVTLLNRLMQVMGILSNDIRHPAAMTQFVLGLLENFSGPGIMLLATRSAELHSTQTAREAREWILTTEVNPDRKRADRALERFRTMVDPQIWDDGWRMMLARGRAMLHEEKLQLARKWLELDAAAKREREVVGRKPKKERLNRLSDQSSQIFGTFRGITPDKGLIHEWNDCLKEVRATQRA